MLLAKFLDTVNGGRCDKKSDPVKSGWNNARCLAALCRDALQLVHSPQYQAAMDPRVRPSSITQVFDEGVALSSFCSVALFHPSL